MNINNVFYTIQGEGANAGTAALFVRMPFCNLLCPWCDTEFNSYQTWTETEFRDRAEKHWKDGVIAVITGGEPSMNKHAPDVIRILKEAGYRICMESNGQFLAPFGVDFLTISPKRWHNKDLNDLTQKFMFQTGNKPGEIKLVVDGDDVFQAAEWIENLWRQYKFEFSGHPNFYLSPEWNTKDKWIPKINEFVMKNPLWRISLQTHKFIGVE